MPHHITTYARRKNDSNVVCCGHSDHNGRHTCGIRFGEVTPEGYLMIDRDD
jgi:hypothetical protein